MAWRVSRPIYIASDCESICAQCVNDPQYPFTFDIDEPIHEERQWNIEGWFTHLEGPPEQCACCNRMIESAYGEVE